MKLEVRGVEFVDDGVHELHVKILGSKAVMTFGLRSLASIATRPRPTFRLLYSRLWQHWLGTSMNTRWAM